MIREIVKRRGIQNLYHFTRLTNLPGIVKNGLIPRKELDASNIEHEVNDEDRHDKCEDGNCLSMSFPNYKMFYSLRQEYQGITWVVLRISANVLWEKDCAFCFENAASNSVTCIPIDLRKGPDAIENIFDEAPGMATRNDMSIHLNYPTNPQAEVLIFDIVEPEYILDINLEYLDPKSLAKIKKQFPAHQVRFNSALFNPRSDWRHWK